MKQDQRKILSVFILTNIVLFCFVRTYKLYCAANFAERLKMFSNNPVDEFMRLIAAGDTQAVESFINDFEQQWSRAHLLNYLSNNDLSFSNFMHQHGTQALLTATRSGHGNMVAYLLEFIDETHEIDAETILELYDNACVRNIPREMNALCIFFFEYKDAEELFTFLYINRPQIFDTEMRYKNRSTTLLIQVFRKTYYALIKKLATEIELSKLLRRDDQTHSALSNAIVNNMAEAYSIILQRISPDYASMSFVDGLKCWSQLGEGAYAQVFCARTADGQVVVLKRNSRHDDVRHCVQELNILQALDSEFIIGCKGAFIHLGLVHVVLEYVKGTDLYKFYQDELIPKSEELHYKVAAEIAYEMQQALCYLCLNLVVHLDIKMENVMVILTGGKLSIKLIDFAFAVQEQTTLYCATGTSGCIAPEIIKATESKLPCKISTKADVFSNGVMIYDLLSRLFGSYLFMRATERESLAATLKHRHSWPPTLRTPMYDSLRAYVDSSLEKDESTRPCAVDLPDPRVRLAN